MSEKDLNAELAEEWKEIQARHTSDSPDEPAEPVEPSEPAEQPAQAADTGRDEQGRFKAKASGTEDAAPTAQPAPADEAQAAAPEAAQPTEATEVQRDLNRAPSSWKPAAKAAWDALPPEIRAEVHRRESDWLRGQSELLPDAQLGRGIRQVIEPYRMLIEAEGGTPETAVGHLLQTAALFRVGTPQQKQQALMSIAQQYGIPMPTGQQDYAQPQQQFADPRVDQMLQQMQLREQQEQWQRQQQERSEVAHNERVVHAWQSAVDSSGRAVRPYAANVEAEMAALIPQIRSEKPSLAAQDVLQEAYDRAIWAHPEIRPLLLKQQTDDFEAKRRAENQLRVAEAKKAASVNVPKRASVPAASNQKRGFDQIGNVIEETARELGLMN